MKKRINPISSALLNIGMSIIENTLVKQIPIEDIQRDVTLILKPVKDMIRVLSDKDPNNKEQVEQVWLEFVRSTEFNQAYKNRIMQAIALIEDIKIRDFVSRIATPCLETIEALYDNNPNNVEQIKNAWINFATEKDNINSILAFFIEDEDVREQVAIVIDTVHDAIGDLLKL